MIKRAQGDLPAVEDYNIGHVDQLVKLVKSQ